MKKVFAMLTFAMFSISILFAHPGGFTSAPTLPALNLNFNNIDGNKMSIHWQNGNGGRRIVIARKNGIVRTIPANGLEYAAAVEFAAGTELSNDEFVVYNGTGNNVTITNLCANSIYHYAVFEYNGIDSAATYLSTALTGSKATLAAPSFPPVSVALLDINPKSMKLSWKQDLLTGSGRIVLVKAGGDVDVNPVDLANYRADSAAGKGSRIGNGNYVVYQGYGNSVTIDNMQPNTTYYVAIFEYNGTEGKVFNISKPVRTNARNSLGQAKKLTVTKKEK
ncbi:hypothetical protein BH11BAC4_BH11BAC4_19970 [soil metagenome]